MQLLVENSHDKTAPGFVRFRLWAKFEITPEEGDLISTYGMANALLVPAFDIRAFKWAFRSGIAASILTFLIFGIIISTSSGLRVSLIFVFVLPVFLAAAAFYITSALIFDKMRDMVIVRDLLIAARFRREMFSLWSQKRSRSKKVQSIFAIYWS